MLEAGKGLSHPNCFFPLTLARFQMFLLKEEKKKEDEEEEDEEEEADEEEEDEEESDEEEEEWLWQWNRKKTTFKFQQKTYEIG